MEGLPFLPGNAFKDPTQTNFHLSHTLDVKSGLRYAKAYPEVGIGGRPLKVNQLTEAELDELANFQPTLTYGQTKQSPVSEFVPAHVALSNKVLRFYGYFKETVNESQIEHYRVRHVHILYFLEDDSMQVTEPSQNNSGIPQGKLVRRHRIPKNDSGDCYNWRDLNLATSLAIYGRVYRITNCDKFTKEFLESEGVVLNEPEQEPLDPYLAERAKREAIGLGKTPSSFDKRRQYLELDRKVLRFYAVQDERHEMFGECRKFVIHYYLADDTLEIREIHTINDGRDPFPLLLRRSKVPKYDTVPNSFPSINLELTENEVKEYFSPKDFHLGQSVNILGRKYLIYDFDNFTKAWYHNNFGITEFTPIDVEIKYPELPKKELPPYNGFGTIEDSLAFTKSFILKPPKVDTIKHLDYAQKVLRYEARLDSVRPDDEYRRFIISYHLGNDMISIFEAPTRNSGFPSGIFLKRTRVIKPGTTLDNPIYYGPADFAIGAKIDIFGTRFIITDADEYVMKFLEANRDQFSDELINCLREHFNQKSIRESKDVSRRDVDDINHTMNEIRIQLKKMSITDKCRIDDMFLTYDKDRQGYIDIENLKDMCKKIHIPPDEDALNALLDIYGTGRKMSLEQFRRFFDPTYL
ncbi:unnamed protein product [Schistosoma turkestanicum]|nr:unnamed protein product [Schistosoma turkestanicum]